MIDLIFDTNILLYLAHGDAAVIRRFREEWQDHLCGMSIISMMEILIGAHDPEEDAALSERLERIIIIPLTEDIAKMASISLRERKQKNLRSPRFADTIIACTALSLNVPLVTNNTKDFAHFENLNIIPI